MPATPVLPPTSCLDRGRVLCRIDDHGNRANSLDGSSCSTSQGAPISSVAWLLAHSQNCTAGGPRWLVSSTLAANVSAETNSPPYRDIRRAHDGPRGSVATRVSATRGWRGLGGGTNDGPRETQSGWGQRYPRARVGTGERGAARIGGASWGRSTRRSCRSGRCRWCGVRGPRCRTRAGSSQSDARPVRVVRQAIRGSRGKVWVGRVQDDRSP